MNDVGVTKIPKIVWMYWAQGWGSAPSLSKYARQSWQRRNPGWNVLAIDLPTVDTLLGSDWRQAELPDGITHTAQSNLVRLALLTRFGGVWADATTFCVRPLDDWIEQHTLSGFFAFERPGGDRALATWFLAARPGSYIAQTWAEVSWQYWENRPKMDEFHWSHRLFSKLLDTNPDFANAWSRVDSISAANPLHLGPNRPKIHEPPGPKITLALSDGVIPVCKLTNRVKPGPPDSTINYLRTKLREPFTS